MAVHSCFHNSLFRRVPQWISLRIHAVLLITVSLVAGGSAEGFQVQKHAQMSFEKCQELNIPSNLCDIISLGAVSNDIGGCVDYGYCPFDVPFNTPTQDEIENILSPMHFDNNRINEGLAFVDGRVSSARSALLAFQQDPSDTNALGVAAGLYKLGQGLHALQDFYSHSTYIELKKPEVRLSGRYNDLPLWQGEDYSGTVTIAHNGFSQTLQGLQTGYFLLDMPAGTIEHDDLAKDSPGTPEGMVSVSRVFPNTFIGTLYEMVSGQKGGSGPYTNDGLAPRHTKVAIQVALSGGTVFGFGDFKDADKGVDVTAQTLAAMNENPLVAEIAAEIRRLTAQYDGVDSFTFPWREFDPETGIPLSLQGAPTATPTSVITETPTPTLTPTGTPTGTPTTAPTATPTMMPLQSDPDINRDGVVDVLDLYLLMEQWHGESETTFAR